MKRLFLSFSILFLAVLSANADDFGWAAGITWPVEVPTDQGIVRIYEYQIYNTEHDVWAHCFGPNFAQEQMFYPEAAAALIRVTVDPNFSSADATEAYFSTPQEYNWFDAVYSDDFCNPCDNSVPIPLDGGLSFLLASGLGLGLFKKFKNIKK